LASDLLAHIDDEETVAAKLATSAPAQLMLYILIISVLSAKQPLAAVIRIGKQLERGHTVNALKLYQATIETGGDCPIPGAIIT
jgi:hypothetical protein